jgi:hypothetical protein
MASHTVIDGVRSWTVADDDPMPRELGAWAVLRTRAIDELTGEPPRVALRVVTPLEDTAAPQARVLRRLVSRSIEGGICGLAGPVADVATALTRPGQFVARIEASGYLPRDLTPAIEQARRTMTVKPAGATVLTVAPGDPIPAPPGQREQFGPGRGVLIERTTVIGAEQFAVVSGVVPATATDVPIDPPLGETRFSGTRVAGVPMHLPDQPLHRAATVRIRGRIQQRLVGPPPALVPAVGAQLGILGYWPTYPSTATGAPKAVDFCAVDPPLAFDHPPGVSVQGCTLTPTGAPLRLLAGAPVRSRELQIAPFGALNPAGGDILRIEGAATTESEFVVTAGFQAPADPLGAARVRLRTATAFVHRATAVVQAITVGGLIGAGATTREAQVGDAVLFAPALGALPASGFVAIEHGTARAAYHRYRRLPTAAALPAPPVNNFVISNAALADADGYFEWPAFARVAQIEIAVMHGGLSIAPVRFALSYESTNPLSIIVP